MISTKTEFLKSKLGITMTIPSFDFKNPVFAISKFEWSKFCSQSHKFNFSADPVILNLKIYLMNS